MKNATLTLLLIFSLAFNLAFVGIWAHNRFLRERPPQAESPEPPAPMAELGLGPEQHERIFAGWRDAYRRVRSLREEAAEARSELLELLEAQEPDQQAIAAQREKLERLQGQIRRVVMDQFMQTQKRLNPQQRRRWLKMMRERGRRWGWHERRRHMRHDRPRPPRPMGPMHMREHGAEGPTRENGSFHWRGEER